MLANAGGAMKRASLRIIYLAVLAAIFAAATLLLLAFDYRVQTRQAEESMLEEARTFSDEMDAVWGFMDNSQRTINYNFAGEFEFKNLHCAIVGKSVGAIFSAGNDYKIRYTNFDPRNAQDTPDPFESAGLSAIYEEGVREYYGVVEYDGARSFRYLKALNVSESCLDCHGLPKGEVDITGHVSEGWREGDVGGAISIVIPYAQREGDIWENVARDMAFLAALMLAILLIVFLLTTRLVIAPLERMGAAFGDVKGGRFEGRVAIADGGAREITALCDRFNAMAEELRGVYDSLEFQVKERTQDLRAANDELRAQQASLEELSLRLADEVAFKSDLLSMVNHELRTPLTSIIALAQFALEGGLPESGERSAWQEVSNSGRLLLEMINNMLDMARSDAGEMRAANEPVDLGEVVSAAKSTIAPLALRYNVSFSASVAPDVPLVMGDYDKLQRSIENLCSNSVKFTPDGGHVRLSVRKARGGVSVMVEDDGIGIAREDQKRIFDRFVQVDSTSTRKYNGSGLGLAIVREYCRLQGYAVSVESELGKGSAFEIAIPAERIADLDLL